jgi:hypothetical protein
MMPIGYIRKLAAEEISDTLKFGGFVDSFDRIGEKAKDTNGKDCYLLRFNGGSVLIYSDKNIVINGIKTKSVREAQQLLQMRIG